MEIKELLDKLAAANITEIRQHLAEVEKETWIKIGVGVVVFILFWMFVISPGWFKRPKARKQHADIQAQMVRLKALQANKPKLDTQKKEIQELISTFQTRLFEEDEIAFLLGKISKVAQEAKVELIASKPVENPEAFPAPFVAKYKKYVYQLTVEGGYHLIADFVSKLEANQRYFQIQSLAIAPQADVVGKQVAEIRLLAVSHNTGTAVPAAPVKK